MYSHNFSWEEHIKTFSVVLKDFILIHSGEVEGSIMLTDSGKLKTKIGDDVKRDSMQNDTCVIFVCFCARKTKKL